MNEDLFKIENLRVAYPHRGNEELKWAVDDVSFTLQPGERMDWWENRVVENQLWDEQRCAYYPHPAVSKDG
jgi:hypothetical protein